MQKTMQYALNICFWFEVFVHGKLKLLSFLMDFVVLNAQIQCNFVLTAVIIRVENYYFCKLIWFI